MLDSGGFTAWTLGTEIDLDALSATFAGLLDDYGDLCDFVLISLDEIPAHKGIDPTQEQIARAIERSRANFDILRREFAEKVLPVFHQNEPLEYFDKLVGESNYIALSPRNDRAERWRVRWAEHVSARAPPCRFHGLATHGYDMMRKVEWYSADSASWVRTAANGSIYWPSATKLQKLAVSTLSPALKNYGAHIDHLKPNVKRRVIDVIQARGYSLAELQTDDGARYRWNAEHLLEHPQNPHF